MELSVRRKEFHLKDHPFSFDKTTSVKKAVPQHTYGDAGGEKV
jgi:hypothetical protein